MKGVLKNTFGLDITNSALTAVELAYSKKGLKVVNFARIELAPGIVEDDCIVVDPEGFKEAMMMLLKEGYSGPFTSRNVIISIPEEKTFAHHLCIPHERADDEEFIMQLAKDFIPIELSEAIIDYKFLRACTSKKEVKCNFMAIHKSIVESLINLLVEVGLKVVAVDVNKNSLIRACENRFQKIVNDLMVVNIDEDMTMFSVSNTAGISYNLDSDTGGKEFAEAIKQALNIPTISDSKALLIELNKNPQSLKKEQSQNIQNASKELYAKLISKALEIKKVAENQDSLKINTICIMGSYSRMPGLAEAFKETFKESEVIQNFQYIQLDENTELFYAKAIGLALRAVLPEANKNEINLLPHAKKQELYSERVTPKIVKSLLALCIILTGLTVFSGILMAKTYFNFQSSELQYSISLEKTKSPYLLQIAQASQQKTQLESQINTILKNALPVGLIMKRIDEFNVNGIALVNVVYKLNKDVPEIRIRAKTASRSETEKFVAKLRNDPIYLKIISPLSNLASKGEQFINVDLVLNTENLMAELNPKPDVKESASKPKMPSKKIEEPVDEPIEDPIEDPIDDTTEEGLAEPAEDSDEEPADESESGETEDPIEESADETIEDEEESTESTPELDSEEDIVERNPELDSGEPNNN